jgi:cation:H+ antiporter
MAAIPILAMLASLAALIAASELMVHELDILGRRAGLSPAALGFVVAIGADAPELSTAIIALLIGSQGIGLGVVLGSNIYNLAGLLGLSLLIVGPLSHVARPSGAYPSVSLTSLGRGGIVTEAQFNVGITVLAVLLILIPVLRIPIALVILLAFSIYLVRLLGTDRPDPKPGNWTRPLALALLSMGLIVVVSVLLVNSAISAIHHLHIAEAIVGVFVLPVATSLPNTWAAISLARRQLPEAVFATAFSSNTINLVFGLALPSLFLRLHPSLTSRVLDGPYLLAMSFVVLSFIWFRSTLSRTQGVVIIALYGIFVVVRSLTL